VIALVVAHSRNRTIGRDGDMPWHLPSDLRRFREITTGGQVIMGRKTYESLPDAFRPLPGRRNMVLSGNPGYAAPGAEVFGSLTAALEAVDGDCFVIGGGQTYREALPLADRVYATEIDADIEGDTTFPPLPPEQWTCVDPGDELSENGYDLAFRTYARSRLYDLDAARTEEQRAYMAGLEASGICIFCESYVQTHHAHPVEWTGEHWFVTRNAYPYAGAVAHYLVVPRRHVTSFADLPDAAGAELWAAKRWIRDRHPGLAFATVERSDDMRLNGGSVAHLHVHVVVLDDAPSATVRFRVSAHAVAPDAPAS
jgi:dihydrofolate reductase/diadenosine tetraphosphate (Ap4A) HIT family hydrolase